jgi:hypothetical protein
LEAFDNAARCYTGFLLMESCNLKSKIYLTIK